MPSSSPAPAPKVTITVRIRLFAALADACGVESGAMRRVELPAGAVVATLWSTLGNVFSASTVGDQWRSRTAIAVNERLATADTPLADGDDIAFLPPVSGG